MEDREQERKMLCNRIEELERLDSNLKGSIVKEKAQYNVSNMILNNLLCIMMDIFIYCYVDGDGKR